MSGRRIIVTGTGGFIGRHLAQRLLQDGHAVVGLDRRPSGLHHDRYGETVVDLLDRGALGAAVRESGADAVLHLAARTDLDETRDLAGYAANIDGVRNLLDAIDATPSITRTICTSTQLVCRIGYTPTGPEDYQPSTLYGESKVRTEQLWREADGAGREWVLVRPTTIWGPGMNPHYLRFFAMVRDGRYFHVGRGPTYKSYGYVRNVVHEYVQLLQAPADQVHRRVFYVADYEPLSLEAWADAFQLALGARAIPHMPAVAAVAAARLGDLIQRAGWSSFPFTSFRLNNVRTSYRVDLSATRTVCGPLPFTWVEGVGETVSWLREVWTRDAERAAMPARR